MSVEESQAVNAVPLHTGMEPYPGYRLRQLVGQGGFAEVWEAETQAGKTIALKFLPCDDSLTASKEVRSIQAVRQLKHPNLIETFQVWCHLGYIIVAMELAEGSLLDLLQAYEGELQSPVPPEQVCLYLTQTAEALDFLNTRQHTMDGRKVAFQHCDVKPSNILLFRDTVKLADFGLASPTSSPLKFHRRAGTLDFTAPEVFQGRLSDWTDQYALAVSYCQLRGGRLPFPDTPTKFVRNYVRPTPDLTMLPEAERPHVARALAPAPQNRWPSCKEFIARLAQTVLE
jgi:serine/threonine protein kinase